MLPFGTGFSAFWKQTSQFHQPACQPSQQIGNQPGDQEVAQDKDRFFQPRVLDKEVAHRDNIIAESSSPRCDSSGDSHLADLPEEARMFLSDLDVVVQSPAIVILVKINPYNSHFIPLASLGDALHR